MFDFSSDGRLNKFSQLLVRKVNTNLFEVNKKNVWQLFLFSINELETAYKNKKEKQFIPDTKTNASPELFYPFICNCYFD